MTSLYVSSVCSNGLRALLISVPAFFVTVGFTALYYFPLVLDGIDDVAEVVLDVAPTGNVWRGRG